MDSPFCPRCGESLYSVEPCTRPVKLRKGPSYCITCRKCNHYDGPFFSIEEAVSYWTPREDTAPTVTPVELREPKRPSLDRGMPHIEEAEALPDMGPVIPIPPKEEAKKMVDENGKLSPIIVSILQAVIVAAAGIFNWAVSAEQVTAIILALGSIVYAVTIVLKTVKMWGGVKEAATTTEGLQPKP
jgi:hypothetical protein